MTVKRVTVPKTLPGLVDRKNIAATVQNHELLLECVQGIQE